MAQSSKAVPLRIGAQGRVVIPVALRRELGLEPGQTLMAHLGSKRLVLETREQILERLRAELGCETTRRQRGRRVDRRAPGGGATRGGQG